MEIIENISNEYCSIDLETYNNILHSKWTELVNKISRVAPKKTTNDVLNSNKAIKQAEIFSKYLSLDNKKVLEIGSGFGINLIVWSKKYNTDYYGIEPDSEGFESSYKISRRLLKNNKIDENRIVNALGEEIPFQDCSFDIVYSTNVLEHTEDPAKILYEALRVLKPGGILQIIFPNYHSYFDGHYAVFHPPILFKNFFPWYVKWVFHRDNAFAKTLRTELNVCWTKKQLKKLKDQFDFQILSLGEDIFFERMKNLNFEAWAGLTKVKKIINLMKKIYINDLIAKFMVLLRSWTPVVITIKKV